MIITKLILLTERWSKLLLKNSDMMWMNYKTKEKQNS